MKTRQLARQQDADEIKRQLSFFGARLRELRLGHELTLEDLAVRSGLSKAFLSRLESGGRQASIPVAVTLSKIFRVSLAFFFEGPVLAPPCTVIRSADLVEKTAKGLKYSALSDTRQLFNVLPMLVKVSPSRRGNEHYRHQGVEWLYVLNGKLTLSIAGNTFELERGDAAHFESHLPHRLIARGGVEAEVLVVAAANWNPPITSKHGEHRSIPAGDFLSLD